MSVFREHNVPKVTEQPIVHDPTFVDPSADDRGAQGVVLTVYCTTTPNDGDIATYVAANNRFEFQAVPSDGAPVTASDGMGGFTVVFDEDGNVVYAS